MLFEVLDALYAAANGNSPGYWLFDEGQAESYGKCSYYAEEQREQLRERLGAEDRELFNKLMDNLDEQAEYERHILFHRGLAIGVMLATLGR